MLDFGHECPILDSNPILDTSIWFNTLMGFAVGVLVWICLVTLVWTHSIVRVCA